MGRREERSQVSWSFRIHRFRARENEEGRFMADLWDEIAGCLKELMPEGSYRVWIEPITSGGLEGNCLTLFCPNQFFIRWVKENYLPLFERAMAEIGRRVELKFQAVAVTNEEAPPLQPMLPMAEDGPGVQFYRGFTFDEFVVGDCNRYAYEACRAAAQEEAKEHLLYLQAASGLGKSHLVQAVGQWLMKRRKRNYRLRYLTANEFTTHVVQAVRGGGMDGLQEQFRRGCDCLLMEEAHALSGRERTQAEFSQTIDELVNRGKLVIITSNLLPREIPKLDPSLRSRLGSGLITCINPPDLPTRRRIVARKARRQGVKLTDEVIEYLAQNLRGDIRRIESAVTGLVAKSCFLRRSIDMELAREVVHELVGEQEPLSTEVIRDLVCRHFRVSKEELASKSRKQAVTLPRQVAMYLSRKFTDASLESIGRLFNRDHATVCHSIKKIEKSVKTSPRLRSQVEFLMEQVEKERWRGC